MSIVKVDEYYESGRNLDGGSTTLYSTWMNERNRGAHCEG